MLKIRKYYPTIGVPFQWGSFENMAVSKLVGRSVGDHLWVPAIVAAFVQET